MNDDEARRSPTGGLSPIVWQTGHITLTDFGMARRAGDLTSPPEGYTELFAPGTGGEAAYPPIASVSEAMERAHHVLEEVAKSADLDGPAESHNYATVGEMLIFAIYHRGYHIGKMTTLRALLGKKRLFG
ncbi:MAG: DinB family protein [Armatimonadota bacterium]|nr:DinB family protein [Armatimonadota bacterium]